jgi:CRP/FNR family cyclic AMP-dependent transcriptional regulator
MNPRELLESVEMFRSLTSDEMSNLSASASMLSLGRNETLFKEHDPADSLYVVHDGRVAITRSSFDERESVLFLMEPGDLLGEMPIFDARPRSANVKALEPSSLLRVPYDVVKELYVARPELLWEVVEMFALRLRTMDDALADTMFLDVAGRTAKRLIELAGDKDDFQLPITQEELARMVGASRERVNKAISSFIRLGWLEQRDRTYRIVNRDAMQQRSL